LFRDGREDWIKVSGADLISPLLLRRQARWWLCSYRENMAAD